MGSILLDDNQGVVHKNAGSGTTVQSNVTLTGDLSVSGAASLGGNLTVSGNLVGLKKVVSSTSTLALSDSGAVLLASGSAAQTFTLPAVATANGFNVTLHAGSAHTHVLNGGTSKIQGVLYHNQGNSTLTRQVVTNRSSITLSNSAAAIGDYITVFGDGVNYHVFGWLNNSASLG